MARPRLPLETWGELRPVKGRKTPTVRAHYRDSDGRTRLIERSGKTLAQARNHLLEALRDRQMPTYETMTSETTIEQAVKLYLDTVTGLADSTMNNYRNALKNVVVAGLGELRLRELTVPRAERFIKAIASSRGPGSAKTIRTVLNNVMGEAVRFGAVEVNPIPATTIPQSERKPIEAPSIASVNEIRRLIREHDNGLDKRGQPRYSDIADLIDLYAATGARTGELLALTWADVTLDGDKATVSISKTLVVGTDNKLKVQDQPKTSRGIRTLKLPEATAGMLTRRRVNAYNDIVFPSSHGTYRWPHNLRRIWREALEGTQYETWTPRDFRKAVATLINDEMGAEAARDQLGHTSTKVTTGHYIQPSHQGPDATDVLKKLV